MEDGLIVVKEFLSMNKVLIVTAVEAEKAAVECGLDNNSRFEVIVGGVGLAEAAVSTAFSLSHSTFSTVISAGIGGGFENKADVESLVVASDIRAVDMGSETQTGFLSLEELDLGTSKYDCDITYVEKWRKQIETFGVDVQTGSIVTTTTTTGTVQTAHKLLQRVPEAKAEAMEGFGVAAAARRVSVPVYEMRAISNVVGPRERNEWKIKEALAVLEKASRTIQEVF